MPYYVGVDLGQTADYTAVAVIEDGKKEYPAGGVEPYLHLRHLERYELRTLYPDIAEGVAALMRDPCSLHRNMTSLDCATSVERQSSSWTKPA